MLNQDSFIDENIIISVLDQICEKIEKENDREKSILKENVVCSSMLFYLYPF